MNTEKILARVFTELLETNKEDCPDIETVCAYVDNSLAFNERKHVGKHLLDCSFCFNSYIDLTEELEKVKDLTVISPYFMKNKSIEKGYFPWLNSLFSGIWRFNWLSLVSSFALGSAITVMIFIFCINRQGSVFFSQSQIYPSGYSSVNYVLTDVSDESIALKHYRDGEIFLKNSKIDRAKEEFLQSIKFNPDQAEAHWYLGSIYEHEGNYKEAINHWKRYISVSPRVGSYKEAKEFLDRLDTIKSDK